MPRIKVKLRGASVSDINLENDRQYIAGRKEDCDIRLQPEKGISREHFKIAYVDGQWTLQLIARFGEVLSQGSRVENLTLQHGVSFSVPPYEFDFFETPMSVETENPNYSADVTPADLESVDMAPPPLPMDDGPMEKTIVGVAPNMPYLKVMGPDGQPKEMLRLESGNTWVAGRDSTANIQIHDTRVSRRQFEIRKQNGAYTILDLGSVNGTLLNGSPISSTDVTVVKSGDAISVLDNIFYFELHDPNFKHRLESIPAPEPMPESEMSYEAAPPEYSYDESLPNPPQYDVPQVYGDQGQYAGQADPNYQYQQGGNPYYSNPPPPMAPAAVVNKFKIDFKNPRHVGLLVAVFAFVGFLAWQQPGSNTSSRNPAQSEDGPQKAASPFDALSEDQRAQILSYYKIAETNFAQEKYYECKRALEQIHQMLPDGYLESKSMLEKTDSVISIQEDLRKEEEKQRALAEEKEFIEKEVTKCRAKLNPKIEMYEMETCLNEAEQRNAADPGILNLKSEVDRIIGDRQLVAEEKEMVADQVRQLDTLFKAAEDIQKQGLALKAIESYGKVLSSDLPDPKKLKKKSERRIASIQEKVSDRVKLRLQQADTLYTQGHIKEAILSLRESLVYDSKNSSVRRKIDHYTSDLNKKLRSIYTESMLEEHFGNIEGGEGRPGAKEKLKRIIELDLQDGEYYRKAMSRLVNIEGR